MAKTDTKRPSSVLKKAAPKAAAKKPSKAVAVTPAKAPAKKTPEAPEGRASPRAAAAKKKAAPRKASFSKTDLRQFQIDLLAMRDRITDQSGVMRSAALQRSEETNVEEDGTNAFLRLQTLEQVGTQQGTVTRIDEALRAISKGSYGACDTCGELISKERLTVLPFARNCIACQSEMERSSRHGRFR